ncbi:MAG: sialate O-acetylesterase [Rubripirellula sp.]|nr:sialate O-acetylesterase [Rubripirellula sp.]
MVARTPVIHFLATAGVLLLVLPTASAVELPGPDGKPVDMSKPVQIYLCLGQSNSLGFGETKGGDNYEIAGFFWWLGDRDSRSEALASRYEKNLLQLIKQLRKDFKAANAKFACATLRQTEKGATDNDRKLVEAMFAIDGKSGKSHQFKGNTPTACSHPLSKESSSVSHYDGTGETDMNIGDARGQAMVELLQIGNQ